MDLKNSLNLSNEYRLKQLNDPINYQVSLRGDQEEISETPLRYMLKDRKIKERDSFGGYRFYKDNLKKRTNPTDEYRKKLEEEILQKKKIISDYEQNGGHLSQNQLKSLQKSGNFKKANSAFNIFDINDIEENAKNVEYSKNVSINENLIKVLDAQVDLLKRQSNDQFEKLTKDNEFKNSLYKTKRYRNMFNNDENGLEEPKVHSQFLAANNSRVQTFKHVLTQDKPEYIPLEELEKIKQKHEKDLKDKEDDYYGRKKISKEELMELEERAKKLLRSKQLFNMIQRPGYNNDNPLDEKDYEFINKYNNYLINKQNTYDKIGYEEEWNTTKVKSQNANGVVDRKDGLPGYLDQDDYRLYYYDINEGQGELNFERPLKIHKHIGKENTLKRTFRNEPGYEETKNKFYRTASAPDFNNITSKNNLNNINEVDESNNIDFVNNGDIIYTNKSINLEGSKNDQFMKLIFGMLTKNEDGEVAKNKIISEMKLDESAIIELGFKNKNELEYKLNNFPTKNPGYMTENEFYSFLLQKNKIPKNYSNININKNQLYKNNIPKKSQSIPISPKGFQKNNNCEILPGMSTSYFDFLKNPSTYARLKHINKTLKGKRAKSAFDDSRDKNMNKSFDFKKNSYRNIRKNKLNKSYENDKNTHTDNNNFYFTTNGHFNINNYNKKSDLNFTIPKPFEFLKEDYHGKKLIKMKEILEERKKNENEIFNHIFHANPLNKRMFDTKGDLRNVIEREKSARQHRVNQRKIEIISSMKPFSFYDADFKSFVERKNQECLPPEFVPFKANPIKYKSQVKMYEGNIKNDKEARQERIHQRALSTFNAASLPPRMEMHEKQKKLQEQEKLLIEKQKEESDKNKRIFKAQKAPNFNLLHEKFINALEKKKRAAQPTVPKPFTFHEPKKKAELCQFLDFENNPKDKNPKKTKNIEIIRKKMQKKPKIEPSSTRSLKLLMETRRKELEDKKIREENIKREDELRRERQNRLNDRVRSSSVIQGNKKALREKKINNQKAFKQNLKENQEEYKGKLNAIYQKVENRPLMMEIQGQKKEIEDMKQDKNI